MVSKAQSAVRQSDDRALRLSVYIDEVLVSGRKMPPNLELAELAFQDSAVFV
jgi:hypothetical protein